MPSKFVPRKIKKAPTFQKTVLPIEQREAGFRMLCFVSALFEALDDLRGTQFYSSRLERELEEYAKTKSEKVFQMQHGEYVADATVFGLKAYLDFAEYMWQLEQQPEIVQERFHKAMQAAFVNAGLTIKPEHL